MPDQNPAPALTHQGLVDAIDAASIGASTHAKFAIRAIRQRLPDFFTKHKKRLPATLNELAELQIGDLTRFKTIAKVAKERSGASASYEEISNWNLIDFLQSTAHLTDKDIKTMPGIGDTTASVFRFMINLYKTLGLITELDAKVTVVEKGRGQLASEWREASASLKEMRVADKLKLLLSQPDDIIAANSRSYFAALKGAAQEYYGTLLTDDLISDEGNIEVTRHIAAKHIVAARQGRKQVFYPYIGDGTTDRAAAFIRSHLATIRDDIQKNELDELPLKIKMLGLLNLKAVEGPHAASNSAKQKQIVIAEFVDTASKAFDAYVEAGRIHDAVAVMGVLKDTTGNHVVVSSGSFKGLLDKVAVMHAAVPPAEYQAMYEILKPYAEVREARGELTPMHKGVLRHLDALDKGVRKAEIRDVAQHLRARRNAEHGKT